MAAVEDTTNTASSAPLSTDDPSSLSPGENRPGTGVSQQNLAVEGSKQNLATSRNPSVSVPRASIAVARSSIGGGGGNGVLGANFGGAGVGGVAAVDQAAYGGQRVYENTYRLKPEEKFQSEKTRKIINDVLSERLKGVLYSAEKAIELSKSLSNEILQALKKLNFDRYKFVVEVVISEFKGQGIRVASRSLWDASTDSYASVCHKNGTISCIAMVFACYVE